MCVTDERRCGHGIAAALLSVVLAACASTVVLLPQDSGRSGTVVVKQGEKEIVLDQPYAAASTLFGMHSYQSNPQEVDALFGAAFAAQPSHAATFTLYFVVGKDELTEESRQTLDKILAEIAKRAVPDILVIGHTDLVGSDQFNDTLGQQRAEMVRAAIIRLGIPPADIRATSRGKREPAVPTADGVAEPRNRRVVIMVR
jgi:OmpA-OmpF porin, OOP family